MRARRTDWEGIEIMKNMVEYDRPDSVRNQISSVV